MSPVMMLEKTRTGGYCVMNTELHILEYINGGVNDVEMILSPTSKQFSS
jgi:hypothetical protein